MKRQPIKRQPWILAGTALGLLMASAPMQASAGVALTSDNQQRASSAKSSSVEASADKGLIILAQNEPEQPEAEGEQPPKKKAPEAESAPAVEEPAPAAEEPAPAPAPEPKPEPAPAAEPAAPVDEPKPAEDPAPQPEVKEPAVEQKPAEEVAPAPVEEVAPKSVPEPEVKPAPAPKAEPAPAPKTAPAPAEPAPAPEPVPEVAPTPEPAPEQPAAPETKPAEPTPEKAPEPTPAPEAPAPAETPPTTAPTPEPASVPEQPATEPAPAPAQTEGTAPAGDVPVLDSQKQPPVPPAGEAPAGQDGEPAPAPQPPVTAEPAAPPPANDTASQDETARPSEIQPVTQEEGTRIEKAPPENRRERPEGSEILREFGDRIIIEFNNQVIVESNDRPRMTRGAKEVYYEDLPRGRTRETIIRDDGTRVVTIRNAYGDVVRRSRITPDEREYVLSYVDDRDFERVRDWRDPGLDLPPMRLNIPVEEYILNAETVEDPDAYYAFLDQPPVEQVERLYSVDEVKRSARIRDKTRRVDLDTVTFEFGKASIPETEISRLEGVATAIERLLKENPAETFLIEGHTDAVGSDLANLALSDRRAEAVADALTNVFGIAPENLATQGYGEQYLKVRTSEPERENRRVAIRRITALVAPVAEAK